MPSTYGADPNQDVSLLDILDVILDKGVVLRGELIISIADIDLVYLDLRLLITSVDKMMQTTTRKPIEEEKPWNTSHKKVGEYN
ncbi:gas vesicle synthesis-like protein [Bacillus sp. THAF10]|uniref:gas vesicle protein n=1 Tax=Bacillus sp. THAF10 TaxID=2587848 RepID=UPI0012690C41|nr:gas vesicle protein [Bacillus sp. THAF10]QFT90420.1 gas vesicle synthesis-like protein [Bacillus sp. THAF10]